MTEKVRALADLDLAGLARLCDMPEMWPAEHMASRETIAYMVRSERKRRRDRPSTLRWRAR